MQRFSYNAATLERILAAFERTYHLDSEDFYEIRFTDDERVAHVPHWHRQSWAIFYRNWLRLGGSGFAESVKRDLELV
jgi:hypothetical protein